ncbi:MAG: hypothetical protein HOO93_13280 [Methyloglobulus sp.]|nr:hypothetical protein [Methyloglobulus sp.]
MSKPHKTRVTIETNGKYLHFLVGKYELGVFADQSALKGETEAALRFLKKTIFHDCRQTLDGIVFNEAGEILPERARDLASTLVKLASSQLAVFRWGGSK